MAMTIEQCPFCGSRDISEGEVLTEHKDGRCTKQNQCMGCGALGPEATVDGPDYGDVQSNAAWNRRAHLTQPAQGRGEAVVGAKGKFISESGYCFSGTLDSVLYKVWLNDGSLVTIGRDEFILDANPTRSSPAVAPDDERLHSGSAEDVAQWLYANGHHDAAFTVRQQLDVRNERIRALESTHLTQPAQAVDVGALAKLADHWDGNGSNPAFKGPVQAAYRAAADELRSVLTRALSGEKAGPVGDGYFPTSPDPTATRYSTVSDAIGDRFTLPASPTPDKEGA